jgi:hypothetical protein
VATAANARLLNGPAAARSGSGSLESGSSAL